jgi:hypothetical protein
VLERYYELNRTFRQFDGVAVTIQSSISTAPLALAFTNTFSLNVTNFKRVIVTPAVYPRLSEFRHLNIQSTGQKSHCVNTISGHHNAMFLLNSWIPRVRFSSELIVKRFVTNLTSLSSKMINAFDSIKNKTFLIPQAIREPNPQSQSFSRSYGSNMPNSLIYIILSTRGC